MSSTLHEPVTYPAPIYYTPKPDRFTAFLMRLWARTPSWTAPAAIATCMGGAVAYSMIAVPATIDSPTYAPTCLVKMTTGFDCPGCGGTRAFFYLIHGNIPAAARHHAVFVFAVPFLIYMYVAWSFNLMFKRQLPMLRVSPTAIGVYLSAWLVFSVLRNLPWAPFTWLYV
jgi:hypothetical protein